MQNLIRAAAAGLLLIGTSAALAEGPVFYGDPPDQAHPWAVHDRNRPQPPRAAPGTFSTQDQPGKPPADAIILFDGTDLSKWEADKNPPEPTKWVIRNGAMECVPGSGYIRTKEQIGDCQLHVEWAAPTKVEGDSQGRGNSGVFLLGQIEVQVLDNYNNPTYADGFASSVYGQYPPLANALRAPGEFQTYDIIFRHPVYKDGKQIDPGYVTVFVNGVVTQDHSIIEGPTGHMARTHARRMPSAGPLALQDHGNPVRYRNIWYRPLPPRRSEGGDRGPLTPEAATAKKKEIAASIRKDAATMANANNPVPQMLRLYESCIYDQDAATMQQATAMADAWIAGLKTMSGNQLERQKGNVMEVNRAFSYLARWKFIEQSYAPKVAVQEIIHKQEWDKK